MSLNVFHSSTSITRCSLISRTLQCVSKVLHIDLHLGLPQKTETKIHSVPQFENLRRENHQCIGRQDSNSQTSVIKVCSHLQCFHCLFQPTVNKLVEPPLSMTGKKLFSSNIHSMDKVSLVFLLCLKGCRGVLNKINSYNLFNLGLNGNVSSKYRDGIVL